MCLAVPYSPQVPNPVEQDRILSSDNNCGQLQSFLCCLMAPLPAAQREGNTLVLALIRFPKKKLLASIGFAGK